jgi:molybdopterin converting factor small subunit
MSKALTLEEKTGRHRRESEEETSGSFRKTLQIATVGEDLEGVLAGVRNAPANKLVLICYDHDKEGAKRLALRINETLKADVEVYGTIRPEYSYKDIMQVFSEIVEKNKAQFDDFLLNVSSGDKMICIAAAVTSFILGFKAFFCKGDECVMLPPMKLSYTEMVSAVKMNILRALDKAGGEVESLDELGKLTNYGKPLLSYHIHGSEDARGLIDLGLAQATRHSRGKTKVTLTTLGKMLLVGKIEA